MLITAKERKILLKGAYVLSIGLLIVVQYMRYENINTNEMVVFNSGKLCVTIKEGNSIICLHTAQDGNTDKLDYITAAYSKVKPGKVRYVKLGRGETKIDLKKGSIQFVKFENGYHVTISPSDENFFLRTSISPVPFNASLIVDMPYIPKASVRHNLSDGCYRLILNN